MGYLKLESNIMKQIILIIFAFFVSCQYENGEKNNFDIWVADSLNNTVEHFFLSDVAQSIDIISLETNKKSVFDDILNLSVGKNDILILSNTTRVLRFDKEGQYLNDIAALGEGPTDFFYSHGIGINDDQKLIHLTSGLNTKNEVKTYTYEGQFIRSVKVANEGAFMDAGKNTGERRNYSFINNKHVFRRMLPIQDGSTDIWQIGVFDTSGRKLIAFPDPINANYKNKVKAYRADEIIKKPGSWFARSPIQNLYSNQVNYLFEFNDTIYRYNENNNTLKPRYILHCGERPDFDEMRKLDKQWDFFQYVIVTNILEVKDYLYLVVEKDRTAYLLRVEKNTGVIQSIQQEGELLETPLMKIKYRDASSPGFTNDLCGGVSFFPTYHNNKQWISVFEASDLLEQINLDMLKKENVVFPEKRDELVRIVTKLKEDDNPVIMIITLK